MAEPAETSLEIRAPDGYHLGRSFSGLRMGPHDPSLRLERDLLELARWTPAGPVTLQVLQREERLAVRTWGPGGGALVERLEALLGFHDRDETFVPRGRVISRLRRRFSGTRLPRLPWIYERLAQVVLLQLVSSLEGQRSWSRLVDRLGSPAPGPLGLRLAPPASLLSSTSRDRMVACGVGPRQAGTLRSMAAGIERLELAAERGRPALSRELLALPGIGRWTEQYVLGSALADPDAVLLGDYNLPNTVAWNLAAEERGTEERMLELLEPYRGHRFRVIRLLWMSGRRAPRRGPRLPLRRW